jgi:hypothetical protein
VKVEYTLTREDVTAFVRHQRKNPVPRPGEPKHLPLLLLVLLGLISAIVLAVKLTDPGPFSVSAADVIPVAGFLLMCFAYFFGGRLVEWAALRAFRRNPAIFARRSLEVSPEGLMMGDATGTYFTPWHALDRVTEDEACVYFFVAPQAACILPRSAFAGEAAFEEFVETAKRYCREGRRTAGEAEGKAR